MKIIKFCEVVKKSHAEVLIATVLRFMTGQTDGDPKKKSEADGYCPSTPFDALLLSKEVHYCDYYDYCDSSYANIENPVDCTDSRSKLHGPVDSLLD